MKLDPDALIQFAAVAEEASFTKAAARLRVAQPWLSLRIRRLEGYLGFPLFDRTTRRVQLTERGAEFLEAAKRIADALTSAEAMADRLQRRDQRRIRIGAPPYSAEIPERSILIARLAEQDRDLVIELDIGWTPILMDRLRRGDLDLAFALAPPPMEDLEAHRLTGIALDVVMPGDDPLAGERQVRPDQLAKRKVGVFTRSLHPTLHDRLFKPLSLAGADLVQMPEISSSMSERVGRGEMLMAIFACSGLPKQDIALERRSLMVDMTDFSIVRHRGDRSKIVETAWRLATGSA
ncbi:LysR family transcriptional regulator [Azospirillum sp. CT11-132]|uniref:LysR family transcriptional regulator n=1 Tax=Azospirillum sp. CT11-132 TaxID=3396317 RepID=UPI0039A7581E